MAVSSYLAPYAQQLVTSILSRISGGRIRFILQYQDPPQEVTVGDGGDEDPVVEVKLYEEGFWVKLCSNFDLVGFVLSKPDLVMRVGTDSVGLCGGVYVPGAGL